MTMEQMGKLKPELLSESELNDTTDFAVSTKPKPLEPEPLEPPPFLNTPLGFGSTIMNNNIIIC